MRNRLASDSGDDSPETKRSEVTNHRTSREINLFELGSSLLRYKRVIGYTVGIMVLLTAGILLMLPNKYTSRASILPSGSQDKLADLKSLAGLGSAMTADENSSELYPSILVSRTVADGVLDARYSFLMGDKQVDTTLASYLNKSDRDREYQALDGLFSVDVDKKTGIIKIAVETESPTLSQAVLSRYVTELENFNLYKRRSQAKENTRYLSTQLAQQANQLKDAEDALQQFQSKNQNWFGSTNGEMVKELTRLQREVEIRTKAYGYLTQQYEIAKLDAQKDVPIVRTLDTPSLPIRKSGPFRTRMLFLVTFLSTLIMSLGCLVADSLRRRRDSRVDPAFDSFRDDLTHAFPRVHRFVFKRSREQITAV
ncbi:MAG TPA: Wzz/FepE/Etk N-terminal domain-containing protein [candidate division Zixibacteria bacterium]|nr:Wzz/FepE/Etk N-terminal domain-containing protein [candidate division Zixibacteria bacterium]